MSSKRCKIAWGITGAGHYLRESIQYLEKMISEFNIPTIVYVSRAGSEVLKMYGLYRTLIDIVNRCRYCEIVFEENEGYSYPKTGKVYTEISTVIISPTTFNTLAKIANGICDTLITNLVAHALKARVPVILVIPDLECPVESEIPIYIDRDICLNCEHVCEIVDVCPRKAVYIGNDGLPHIDLVKCDRCGICVNECPRKAIQLNKRVMIYQHPLLASLVEKVRSMGIVVFSNPENMWNSMVVREILERTSIVSSSRTS